MPLRYERAGGGPETWNPAGVRADAPPDPPGHGGSGGAKAPRKRMSQAERDLIGAAGAFLVYQYWIKPLLSGPGQY